MKTDISFFDAVKLLLKNWNVFSGTCSRKEFWYGQIFLFLSFVLLLLLSAGTVYLLNVIAPKWVYIVCLFVFINLNIFLSILNWTQFVRRYHDIGLSGQMYWLNILSVVMMSDIFGVIFNGMGFALFIACYVIASLPSKK